MACQSTWIFDKQRLNGHISTVHEGAKSKGLSTFSTRLGFKAKPRWLASCTKKLAKFCLFVLILGNDGLPIDLKSMGKSKKVSKKNDGLPINLNLWHCKNCQTVASAKKALEEAKAESKVE